MPMWKGIARTQSPTNKNYALELPTFGVIVGVNPTFVQWSGLALEEPPSWSRLTSAPGKYAWAGAANMACPTRDYFIIWPKERDDLIFLFVRTKSISSLLPNWLQKCPRLVNDHLYSCGMQCHIAFATASRKIIMQLHEWELSSNQRSDSVCIRVGQYVPIQKEISTLRKK